jgi:hypothetical protein
VRTVIGEILPLAPAVTVSPINIIAGILLLFGPRPIPNASAYLAVGVGAAITVVFGVVLIGKGIAGTEPGRRARLTPRRC